MSNLFVRICGVVTGEAHATALAPDQIVSVAARVRRQREYIFQFFVGELQFT